VFWVFFIISKMLKKKKKGSVKGLATSLGLFIIL
jgi:hypothetical protein